MAAITDAHKAIYFRETREEINRMLDDIAVIESKWVTLDRVGFIRDSEVTELPEFIPGSPEFVQSLK